MDAGPSVEGRTILVTGAARRVGAAIARHLGRRGARVIVHHRSSSDAAAALVDEIGGGAFAEAEDLALPEGARELVARCVARGVVPDAVVHAASSFLHRPALETSAAEWDQVFALNLRAFYLLAREVAAARDAEAVRGPSSGSARGDLVAIADTAALELWPGYLAHSVSKAALVTLVKGLAKVMAPGWKVNAVVPGVVLPQEDATTEEIDGMRARTLLGEIGSPQDVARAVEFLLVTPFATGSTVEVTGGSELWRGVTR